MRASASVQSKNNYVAGDQGHADLNKNYRYFPHQVRNNVRSDNAGCWQKYKEASCSQQERRSKYGGGAGGQLLGPVEAENAPIQRQRPLLGISPGETVTALDEEVFNVPCNVAWCSKDGRTYMSISRANCTGATGARDRFAAAKNNSVHLCVPNGMEPRGQHLRK